MTSLTGHHPERYEVDSRDECDVGLERVIFAEMTENEENGHRDDSSAETWKYLLKLIFEKTIF